ncbi:hypothetical protein ABIB49_000259 [Arthrobacter sp. UYCu512]
MLWNQTRSSSGEESIAVSWVGVNTPNSGKVLPKLIRRLPLPGPFPWPAKCFMTAVR